VADGPVRAGGVTPTAGALLLGGSSRREPAGGQRAAAGRDQLDPRQFPLGTVLAVAAAEEAFYRGVLLRAALLPAGWVGPALAVATVVAFALGHVTFGWPHVLAKAPLGVGAAVATVVLGSVLPALVAHVWFNLSVWRDLRAAPR
jgi:membrane protease YdiL (CAAX protease family)